MKIVKNISICTIFFLLSCSNNTTGDFNFINFVYDYLFLRENSREIYKDDIDNLLKKNGYRVEDLKKINEEIKKDPNVFLRVLSQVKEGFEVEDYISRSAHEIKLNRIKKFKTRNQKLRFIISQKRIKRIRENKNVYNSSNRFKQRQSSKIRTRINITKKRIF